MRRFFPLHSLVLGHFGSFELVLNFYVFAKLNESIGILNFRFSPKKRLFY